jgi:hypothetical protein
MTFLHVLIQVLSDTATNEPQSCLDAFTIDKRHIDIELLDRQSVQLIFLLFTFSHGHDMCSNQFLFVCTITVVVTLTILLLLRSLLYVRSDVFLIAFAIGSIGSLLTTSTKVRLDFSNVLRGIFSCLYVSRNTIKTWRSSSHLPRWPQGRSPNPTALPDSSTCLVSRAEMEAVSESIGAHGFYECSALRNK